MNRREEGVMSLTKVAGNVRTHAYPSLSNVAAIAGKIFPSVQISVFPHYPQIRPHFGRAK